MKVEININLEVPSTLRKAILGLGIPIAVVVGTTALVLADVPAPKQFTAHSLISAADINANFNNLTAALNDPDPACPRGYSSAGPAATFLPSTTRCTKGRDVVVKVGVGASAFWIDRYEATAWTTPDAKDGTQVSPMGDGAYGAAGLPKNGQGKGVFALSVADVVPNTNITWFQAVEACAASGKRLPTAQEWLRAARGTFDPGENPGLAAGNNKCNTKDSGPRGTNKALGNAMLGSCVSDWGAEDMVGNFWEWTADWLASVGNSTTPTGVWPEAMAPYNGDIAQNITSETIAYPLWVGNLPASISRGGHYTSGTGAGVFAFAADRAPSNWNYVVGFRCMIPPQ